LVGGERDYYKSFYDVSGKMVDEISNNYEIYKLLGPKEIIIIVKNLSIEGILK